MFEGRFFQRNRTQWEKASSWPLFWPVGTESPFLRFGSTVIFDLIWIGSQWSEANIGIFRSNFLVLFKFSCSILNHLQTLSEGIWDTRQIKFPDLKKCLHFRSWSTLYFTLSELALMLAMLISLECLWNLTYYQRTEAALTDGHVSIEQTPYHCNNW